MLLETKAACHVNVPIWLAESALGLWHEPCLLPPKHARLAAKSSGSHWWCCSRQAHADQCVFEAATAQEQ